MADYLNRERMRVVERNEKGNVTYRKRYRFGDKVDVSHMDEDHAENLRNSGVLVGSKEDLRDLSRGTNPYPGSRVTGAATGEAGDHSEIEPEAVPESDEQHTDSTDEGDDGHVVDQFDAMDYSELQDAAKKADPPIAANQSADELRAALREQA